ncbi:uncharacterized protein ISCGN_006325 [Ixodes scapularis]
MFSVMDPNEEAAESDSSDSSWSRDLPSTPKRWFKKHKSGHILNSGQRELLLNMYVRMRHTEPDLDVIEACKAVSKLAGVSVSSVLAIKKEASANDGQLASPSRKGPTNAGKKRRTAKYGDLVLCALRSCVHRFFRRNEMPTVEKIAAEFRTSPELPSLQAWTVRRLLLDIGFRRERRARNSLMVERDDIVAWQQTYLRDITRHRQEGRQIFYLDETWVTAGHTALTVWVDSTVTSSHDAFMRGLTTGLKQPSGKGQRFIVTHIGSEDGFVPGCLDVFRGKKTGDYHEEMDGPRFEKWFDDVLQKLPTGSVIVMDNAPCHSRRLEAVPTTSSRKELIQGWLTSKGIAWDAKMLKRQLLEIVSSVKPQYVKYRVDTAAERAGCTVVRLPPYHCEFNPIELIWAQIKNRVAARNTMFKIGDVERLLKEEAEQVTASNWCNAVRHVVVVEESFKQGGTTSAHIEPIVIALNEGDTSSESDPSTARVGPLDDP